MERATASHAVGDGADDDDDEIEIEMIASLEPLYLDECSQVIFILVYTFYGLTNALRKLFIYFYTSYILHYKDNHLMELGYQKPIMKIFIYVLQYSSWLILISLDSLYICTLMLYNIKC